MPKYLPLTAKLKAQNLTKSLLQNNWNQAALARKEGVSRAAINQRISHLPTEQTLKEALRKAGINSVYKAKKFRELMEAKEHRTIRGKLKQVSDNHSRLGALKLVCEVDGDIKSAAEGGIKDINIIHAYRKDKIEKVEDASRNT